MLAVSQNKNFKPTRFRVIKMKRNKFVKLRQCTFKTANNLNTLPCSMSPGNKVQIKLLHSSVYFL